MISQATSFRRMFIPYLAVCGSWLTPPVLTMKYEDLLTFSQSNKEHVSFVSKICNRTFDFMSSFNAYLLFIHPVLIGHIILITPGVLPTSINEHDLWPLNNALSLLNKETSLLIYFFLILFRLRLLLIFFILMI